MSKSFVISVNESAANIIKQLRSEGFIVPNEGKGHKALVGIYFGFSRPTIYRLCNKTGWQGDNFTAFVLPDGTSFDRIQKIQSIGEVQKRQTSVWQGTEDHRYHTKGTLEEWTELVASPSQGNPMVVDSIIMALSTPFVRPTSTETIIVHIYGQSRNGKSTMCIVGGSVWGGGHPKFGFGESWHSTGNALELTFVLHDDGYLYLDEIGEVSSGKDLSHTAYSAVNGSMKGRMGAPKRHPATWRFLGISNGEESFPNQLRKLGVEPMPGQEARIISIPADGGKGLGVFANVKEFALRSDLNDAAKVGEFGKLLTINARDRAYGTAIRALLDALMIHYDVYLGIVREHMKAFLDAHVPPTATPIVRHVANSFALKYGVAHLPIVREITGWREDEGPKSVVWVWDLWLRSLGPRVMSEFDAQIAKCRAYLTAHADELRRTLNGEEVLVIGFDFDQKACGGFDSKAVLHWLKANGFLLHDKDNRLTRKMKMPSGETANMYVIKATFLKG